MTGNWLEHHRDDGELLGWLVESPAGVAVHDLLGSERGVFGSRADAEDFLDGLGLSYLAEPYELDDADGGSLRVRLVEVSRESITVKEEDFGAIDGPARSFVLPFPAPRELHRRR